MLIGHFCFGKVCDRIKYLKKISDIMDSTNHIFARIWIDWYNSSPIEKIWTFMFQYSLRQLIIRIETTTTLIYILVEGSYKQYS